MVIPFGIFLALRQQGKEDKEKFKQKNCCGAVGVRLPSA
jgi:hypothetical protein